MLDSVYNIKIGGSDKTIPRRGKITKMQSSCHSVRRGFTNSCRKKKTEKQGRKGKVCPTECRVPETKEGEIKKAFIKMGNEKK